MKKKTFLIICLKALLFFPIVSFAQEVAGSSIAPQEDPLIKIGLWMAFIAVSSVIIIALLYIIYALLEIKNQILGEDERAKTPAFSLTDAVSLDHEHQILLDHDYDGIRELDNNLPPWWVAMFYGTLVFGIFYIWFYHFRGEALGQVGEYQTELVEAEEQQKLMANKVDENSVKLLTDAAKLQSGEAIFAKNCAACHGKLGEGGVGPNLTDAYWLHGGDIQNIFKTIKYGVPSKGMIPWQAQLGPSQIQEVASYIKTLKGTNPPNGKAAQGELETE